MSVQVVNYILRCLQLVAISTITVGASHYYNHVESQQKWIDRMSDLMTEYEGTNSTRKMLKTPTGQAFTHR